MPKKRGRTAIYKTDEERRKAHRKANREYYYRSKSKKGTCLDCGGPCTTKSTWCYPCYAENHCYEHGGLKAYNESRMYGDI